MSCSFRLFVLSYLILAFFIFARYSHGYLFPSEVTRVKRSMLIYHEKLMRAASRAASRVVSAPSESGSSEGRVNGRTPSAWAHSSVSTFGVRYDPPLPDLSPAHGVEALVEGSEMSMLREGEFRFVKKLYHFFCLILH